MASSNDNWTLFVFFLSAAGLFFANSAYAGTLACAVRSGSCSGGEVNVLKMSDTANAHAGLPGSSGYSYLVCCGNVTGLGTNCTGTSATVLKLSKTDNSHVQESGSYANSVCLSVPTGGTVSAGFAADCGVAGYDTTLASIKAATNSHLGDASAYPIKVCASAHGAGSLSSDIVDAGGASVASPSFAMSTAAVSISSQTVTGVFGTSSEKIRVSNSTVNSQWTMSLAATDGATALWSAGAPKYDFNDPTANAGDGADADAYGGRMSVNFTSANLTPSGCTNTGVSMGSAASFSEGVTDSVTLLTAGSTAAIDCHWDLIGVGISQTVPASQAAGSYSLNMTLTVVAN